MRKSFAFCLGSAAVAVLCLSLGSGCFRPPVAAEDTVYDDLRPVTGSIAFQGAPIEDASIKLHPVKGAAPGEYLPSAVVKDDGTFIVYSYRPEGRGVGAPPGEYVLTVSWRGPLQGLSESSIDELKELLPKKYTDPRTSDLKFTVTDGENVIPHIEIE
jgi:hypothetical protein